MGKNSVTVKRLEQLYWLNREIEAEQARLSELEGMLYYGQTATGLPRLGAEERRMIQTQLEECRQMLKARITRAAEEYRRLCRFIDRVDDSLMRQILSLRYINGLPWQQIAFMIGESDEQFPRRKHNAFLQKLQKKKVDENDETSPLK